mmetsp:Transcript_15376/g.37232  ORF Transcript_15376/g.37232 Transcript_15376/m.37232 type:complete len:268 (-) Transcript_15376:1411-2214(-)
MSHAAVHHSHVGLVCQGGDHGGDGARAERVQHGLLHPQKLSDSFLKVHVRRKGAVEPTRGARSQAEFFDGCRTCLLHHRVIGQCQHVLRGQHHFVLLRESGHAGQRVGVVSGGGAAEVISQRSAVGVQRSEARRVSSVRQTGGRGEGGGALALSLRHALYPLLLLLLLQNFKRARKYPVGRLQLKLEREFVGDVRDGREGVGQVLSGVCGGHAEAHARKRDGRGGGADHDHGQPAIESESGKIPNLIGLVKHHRHHRGRVVAQHLQP